MGAAIEAVLIGAGERGARSYAPYALQHPDELRFVAVAEPDPERRAWFAHQHHIPPNRQFETWEPLLELPQLGQAALVCTQDQQHTAPTLAALAAGYDVLLEKPMATRAEECRALVDAAESAGRQLHICHVLRYTGHFQEMRRIIQSGELGQIITVDQRENVSWWHMAHSYVRGNWRNTAGSAPMILAKCCHDFDILLWLLDRQVARLSSVGGLRHFRPEQAPPGAALRCTDGCAAAETCPFYAPWIYETLEPLWRGVQATSNSTAIKLALELRKRAPALLQIVSLAAPDLRQALDYRGWPVSVLARDPARANIRAALETGPYGRCVYACDNDVVDEQVVLMAFEDDLAVTLTMHGHSHLECRTTRIQGAQAELQAMFGQGGSWIEIRQQRSGAVRRIDTSARLREGHGGGDEALVANFLKCLRGEPGAALTTARQALESHLLAFAAEQARLEARVIHQAEWR